MMVARAELWMAQRYLAKQKRDQRDATFVVSADDAPSRQAEDPVQRPELVASGPGMGVPVASFDDITGRARCWATEQARQGTLKPDLVTDPSAGGRSVTGTGEGAGKAKPVQKARPGARVSGSGPYHVFPPRIPVAPPLWQQPDWRLWAHTHWLEGTVERVAHFVQAIPRFVTDVGQCDICARPFW